MGARTGAYELNYSPGVLILLSPPFTQYIGLRYIPCSFFWFPGNQRNHSVDFSA